MDDAVAAQGDDTDGASRLAEAVAARFAALPEVVAVALAGSRLAGPVHGVAVAPDADLDLYVYARRPVPPAARAAIAREFAGADGWVEVDNRFWEDGDEWRDARTGLWVDVTYRSPGWIEGALARVLDRHEAALGYTTCFWHNVLRSRPLFDRDGWYGRLQAGADRPYPEGLRRAIVAKNVPVLRRIRSAYLRQLDAALRRGDPVAVNHRLAALLASFFDVLFALNRQPHPGEKRLLAYAEATCPKRPFNLAARVADLLTLAASLAPGSILLVAADALIADLEVLLIEEGLFPSSSAGDIDR
jgi:hypothetical protein